MRGLDLWMGIIAGVGFVFFQASVVFGESAIAKGPTPGGIYIVGPGHGTNYPVLYYSSDYGKTITPMDSTSDMFWITADASEGGVYYESGGGGLYYSQDYGGSFVYQSGHCESPITSGCIPGEIYKLYYGTQRSIDYGKTFNLTGEAVGSEISVGPLPGEIYAMYEREGKIYFSFDYGDTFALKHDFDSPASHFWSLRRGAISGEVYLLCTTTGQLYYSSDYGETFEEKKKFPGYDYWWGIDMVGGVNQGDVFVERDRIYSEGGGEIQIYYSADYGSTFVEYKHKFNAVEEEPGGGGLPREVKLGQNWPNPFNSNTAISYQRSAVSLKIYNILGKEVRTLISQEQKAGRYEVVWDGRDNQGKEVSSGVYFCELKVGRFNQTRKMLLSR